MGGMLVGQTLCQQSIGKRVDDLTTFLAHPWATASTPVPLALVNRCQKAGLMGLTELEPSLVISLTWPELRLSRVEPVCAHLRQKFRAYTASSRCQLTGI
jgi:hypothetical protein